MNLTVESYLGFLAFKRIISHRFSERLNHDLILFLSVSICVNLWLIILLKRENLSQHSFDYAVTRFQSVGQFRCVRAAAFRHIGFAAAATADDWRDFLHNASG